MVKCRWHLISSAGSGFSDRGIDSRHESTELRSEVLREIQGARVGRIGESVGMQDADSKGNFNPDISPEAI